MQASSGVAEFEICRHKRRAPGGKNRASDKDIFKYDYQIKSNGK
jgi:hypothetical protein